MRRDGNGAAEAILIAGPTASGKSALAIALAQRFGGTIINADSMQIYADLTVLSSRPGAVDLAQAPHRLFGHVDGAEPYSVARWLTEVASEIEAARQSSKLPIVVGGTGLYFKALTQGLSAIPTVPQAVRDRVRREAESLPVATLHARLALLDPATAARLRPTDPQRIIRALEVFEATGRSLASFQGDREPPVLPTTAVIGLCLTPERTALNARIDARFDRMVADGALDEVATLGERRLDPALPVMRALGVPSFLSYLDGSLTLDEAIAAAKLQTRQYAKRQMTFARHQLNFTAVQPDDAAALALLLGNVGSASS
ncbi:tRNA (adenosine(37)-N6)-dimethylallyltransferase MiaA [Lichenihabitans psoromatis]|uniref:tRNA (adenosine(37)-N6)-dimethylallyltransferase MiaA n=1 Tax=Lichenihabitans psoromatis TaxID=2528642 RepID=UPI001036EC49|nr:tRNA (adenosine(37)-N6)-dimethylallyltransferase MiaA [Lichenihabitans psoromatis]